MSDYIKYVIDNFPKNSCILEIGAGHRSTKAFATHFYKLYSIEHNRKFIGHYNSNYIQISLNQKTGWYNAKQFSENLPQDYDLLILDGPPGGHDPRFSDDEQPNRDKDFRHGFCESFSFIKKDVIIIVDDTHRNWKELEVVDFLKQQGYETKVFKGFTVCTPKQSDR